jgi:YD repeat-containing protein
LRGRLAAVRDAVGNVVRWESYDVFGNATRVVDANGVAVESIYDHLGRSLQTVTKGVTGCDTSADPLCGTDLIESQTYLSMVGPLHTVERPGAGISSYAYDGHGRVAFVSRGTSLSTLAERVEYDYEDAFNQKSEERYMDLSDNSVKRIESYHYDESGRLETTTRADGAMVVNVYNDDGEIVGIKDENHGSPNTTHTRDPAGRIKTVSQTLTGWVVSRHRTHTMRTAI